MPFSGFKLHPNLLRGLKDLGFTRPTPIQADAIPPAMDGRDLLACAMTGSGKTAAFLLPILHRLIDERARHDARARPHADARAGGADRRGPERPGRPHAAHGGGRLRRRRHGPAGARLPQRRRRHRRRRPGRLLDHFRGRTRSSAASKYLVLDEADRMLDMGFLPDIRRVLRHLPTQAADAVLQRDDAAADRGAVARDAAQSGDDQPRAANGAGDRHHAGGLSGGAAPEGGAAASSCSSGDDSARRARVHAHQAPRQPAGARTRRRRHQGRRAFTATDRRRSAPRRSPASRAGSTACSSPPTSPRAASTSRRSATSSTSTCRAVPEDYIHRVGRTARAELTGDGVHVRLARRRGRTARHRARDRQAAAARHAARLRLQRARRGRSRRERPVPAPTARARPSSRPAGPGPIPPALAVTFPSAALLLLAPFFALFAFVTPPPVGAALGGALPLGTRCSGDAGLPDIPDTPSARVDSRRGNRDDTDRRRDDGLSWSTVLVTATATRAPARPCRRPGRVPKGFGHTYDPPLTVPYRKGDANARMA